MVHTNQLQFACMKYARTFSLRLVVCSGKTGAAGISGVFTRVRYLAGMFFRRNASAALVKFHRGAACLMLRSTF